jgi:hypothetical protein
MSKGNPIPSKGPVKPAVPKGMPKGAPGMKMPGVGGKKPC